MAVTEDILSHLVTPRTQRAISEVDLLMAIETLRPPPVYDRPSSSDVPKAFKKGWMTAVEDQA